MEVVYTIEGVVNTASGNRWNSVLTAQAFGILLSVIGNVGVDILVTRRRNVRTQKG